MKFYFKKKMYINKYTLQYIPIAAEETPDHPVLQHFTTMYFSKEYNPAFSVFHTAKQ